jgi:hypothetical protein
MFYGNHLGRKESGQPPTYVFPIDLREELRRRFREDSTGSRDQEFDKREEFFIVTWEHIRGAKWPNPQKACQICKSGRGKPY